MMAGQIVGLPTPRLHTPPLQELTEETSLGYDIIWFAREILGQPLTAWQEWFVIHAFELMTIEAKRDLYPDKPHLWGEDIPRFKTVVLLIARQNGKTHVAKVIVLWALFRRRLAMVLGAAQTKHDAKSLWEEVLAECEDRPAIVKRMKRTSRNNGSEAIRSKWGVYHPVGIDRKAGRGKTANILFMDELREHKTWHGWSALSSTTLSPVFGINLAASNAGDARSVVLASLRDAAIAAIEAENTAGASVGLFEWSADPDAAIDDRTAWAQANPDLGHGRMTLRDIQSEYEAKTESEFRTENLCQWVEDMDDFEPAIDLDTWDDLRCFTAQRTGDAALAVNVSPGSDLWTVAAAMETTGKPQIEVGYHGPTRKSEIVKFIKKCVDAEDPVAVVIPNNSPAKVLVQPLKDAGIEAHVMNFAEMKLATAGILQAAKDGDVGHSSDPLLAASLAVAELKTFDDGATAAWSEPRSDGDISPLVASTYALWALEHFTAEEELPPEALAFIAANETHDHFTPPTATAHRW